MIRKAKLMRTVKHLKAQIYSLSCAIYEGCLNGCINTADIIHLRALAASVKNIEALIDNYENDLHGGREVRVYFSDFTGDLYNGEQDD